MAVVTTTPISVEMRCAFRSCEDFATPLLMQLSRGYEVCSVMAIPASVDEWRDRHRTARKRAARAASFGYQVREVAREEHLDDIHAINISLEMRQGRVMAASYKTRPDYPPLPVYPCPRHRVSTYGVTDDRGTLVAYLWLYRAGELALVSSILGHGAHLERDVMYLLFQGVVERESVEPGFLVYNRHDSGTDGLRYFKEKLGFERTEVEWRL